MSYGYNNPYQPQYRPYGQAPQVWQPPVQQNWQQPMNQQPVPQQSWQPPVEPIAQEPPVPAVPPEPPVNQLLIEAINNLTSEVLALRKSLTPKATRKKDGDDE